MQPRTGRRASPSCSTDTDCISGAFCDNGTCTTKKAAGATCANGTECSTGYCADKVCCDSACTGQCEACNVAPNKGTCVPVTGTPEHAACTGAGTPCGGTCDGVNRSACSYPGSEQSCGTPACSNGAAQASVCDSKGHCGSPTTTQCAPYLCSGTACGTTCSADTDCANGYQCDTSKKACIPTQTGKCSQDKTKALDADGNVVQDCAPLLCTGGHCNQLCAKSADCVPGYVCDTSNGQCVKPEPGTASNSGGCGCRTAGQRGRDGEAPLFLALGLVGLALRRRRAA